MKGAVSYFQHFQQTLWQGEIKTLLEVYVTYTEESHDSLKVQYYIVELHNLITDIRCPGSEHEREYVTEAVLAGAATVGH